VGRALSVLEPRFPSVAANLPPAQADALAYLDFPVDHRRSISSTNAIERVNAELDRRAKVEGIFLNTASLLRLFTALAPGPARRVAGRAAPFQSTVDGSRAAPRRSTVARQPAHGGTCRLAHRCCENSAEFTPLPGTWTSVCQNDTGSWMAEQRSTRAYAFRCCNASERRSRPLRNTTPLRDTWTARERGEVRLALWAHRVGC
jgi:Transposase, Mutator family